MHERSLVQALLTKVERLAVEKGAVDVQEIRVQLGSLSGVEPLLIESAFQLLAPASPVAGAKLVIEEVPLTAQCIACRQDFEIVHFEFRCPKCGDTNIKITSGDGFILESITVRSVEAVGAGG